MNTEVMMSGSQSDQPILYVPHGGGPMPLMNDPAHKKLINALVALPKTFNRPTAIIVITAHWEENKILISSNAQPSMLFDYYGFPLETYRYKYPAPGHPVLAQECLALLRSAGIDSDLDHERGFDHGTFVPLMLMYPEATIPVVQISLHHSLAPQIHLDVGRAISGLNKKGVLILGSGMSFHNMNAFFNATESAFNASKEFDTWLVNTLCSSDSDLDLLEQSSRRLNSLTHWASAPSARFCHPREEHLLPLLVCLGAAQGNVAQSVFSDSLLNMQVSGFRWS